MKEMKRILSLVLCMAMLIGMMPMFALNADAATGEVIDAAIFCSDVHGNSSAVSSAFNGIKSADTTFNPSTATFVGDTQMAASSVTSAAQSVYSDVACYYAYGNHDGEGNYGISDVTGLLYSGANYYIYAISQTSMASSNPDTSGFTSTVAGLDKTKPLFIASHLPLHARRGDSNGAAAWYEAISAAAEQMDIVFFWAHNHTGENEVDEAAFYVAKDGDETITLENTSTVVKPNFTYMNAGFVGMSSSRRGVVTTVKIYSDALVFQDYTSSGAFTGEYSHNVEVAREFASSSGSTTPTNPTNPTDPEETTPVVTSKEVYVLVDSLTNGGEYLIVNTNVAGSGYAMNHSSGAVGAAEVTIQTSGDHTYIDLDDSTAVWTATTKSSGFELMNGSYYFEAYGSTSAIAISTTQAYSGRYWVYDGSASTLGYFGGNGDHYVYYDSGFVSAKNSGSEAVYIYEKQTIEVSGGGSGDDNTGSGDSGNTGDSNQTVVGEATVNTATDGSWQTVTMGSTKTETKTVYVLTEEPTAGKSYLIVNGDEAGSYYALANNNGSVAATGVTIKTDSEIGTYIELADAADELWTVASGLTFKNGSQYLGYTTSGSWGNTYTFGLSTTERDWSYSTNNNRLSTSVGNWNATTYYLRYNEGWTWTSSSNASGRSVYFYVPTEITSTTGSSTTYSVTASDVEYFLDDSLTDSIEASTNKDANATFTYEVLGGDDIIASIDADGTIHFNGTTGTAQVKVSYTWNDGENEYTIWKVINVTATEPYYELNLYKADVSYVQATAYAEGTTYFVLNEDGTYSKAEGVTADNFAAGTYYTLSYTLGDEITAPIAIKGIEAGDQYGVWAVVKKFDGTTESGTDMGAVGGAIEWSSSDPSVATVNPATGIITFTGKEGTVKITATYLEGNQPFDTITISVTPSQYTIPSDGTTDFPEYPNEGAIRFDKNATAVGNFSETGIAQVELSMTGVPYTKGSEVDVVLMLDMTGSMDDVSSSTSKPTGYVRIDATIAASKAFISTIVKNEDGSYNGNRVGVYVFNKNGAATLFDFGTVDSDTELNAIYADLETIKDDHFASGGTPYDDGLKKCYDVLAAAKKDGIGNDRQQFTVFMTDGVPTSYAYVNGTSYGTHSSASAVAGMLTSASNYATRDTDYKYEYYSTEMKKAGVTVYAVGVGLENENNAWSGSSTQCLNLASALLNDISGPGGETTQPDGAGSSAHSKQDKYFFSVEDATAGADMTKVFSDIAVSILQAATDVAVEDKITDEYTMIFDIPEGTRDITGVTNDFYIEFGKYALDEDHERTTFTSVTKLYLQNTNGTLSAKDAATPVFEAKTIGDKGTVYYWTTDDTGSGISVPVGNTTYYFAPKGMKASDEGFDAAKWFNLTSGAYAKGTVDATNMSQDLVIATPYFVYNAATRMLYWTVDKLDTEECVLRYFLYLDNSATEVGTSKETDPGSYLTNEYAYITYTNFNGNPCRQEFPKPQMTWSGAQVSYVFYLVNAQGQPINKSGQVVDFANATFVTDIYTENTVWNKGEDGKITADSQLSIDWLAANLLPSDYMVYDEGALYQLHVYGNHDGTSNFDYFIIDGNDAATISSSLNSRLTNVNTTASTVSLDTTKVYNTKAGEKITGYGTYASETATGVDEVLSGFDFYNTTVAFAVVWQPALAPDTVVVDYGLDVLINVCQNDLMQDNTISGIGLSREAYGNAVINTGISTESKLGTAALTVDGNTISLENENQIRFSQGDDMLFNAPVTFYYESKVTYYEGSNQAEGYLHSSVTVIPATTIYYEDTYVDFFSYSKDENGNMLEDTGKDGRPGNRWFVDGNTMDAVQAQDRPGANLIAGVLDANNNYGFDAAYENMSTYSMGSASKIVVNPDIEGWADFEFYGTGFDVIATSSNTTGAIVVEVYEVNANGSYDIMNPVKSVVVDTYFGFARQDGQWVAVDSNDPNALYQVPVMKIEGLPYADEDGNPIKYHGSVLAFYGELFDHAENSQFEFALDAIRIYDPTGNQNDVANDAYVADGEGWPTYKEVRDYVIEQSTTDNLGDDAVEGIVFIDSNSANASVADYESFGPNNELYLAPGQAIAFELSATAKAGKVAKIQLAVKTVVGSASIKVYSTDNTTALDADIATATDMYYDITALNGKTVVIKNDGASGVLSITNVKVTYTEAQPEEDQTPAPAMFMLRRSSVDAALATMNVEEEVPETTIPEETVPETTVPEETEPETTIPEETEPETTIPEETEPETTVPEETEPSEPSYEEKVEEIVKEVGKIIKKFLGWIFG